MKITKPSFVILKNNKRIGSVTFYSAYLDNSIVNAKILSTTLPIKGLRPVGIPML